MSTYAIQGIPSSSPGVLPARREIDNWWSDEDNAAQQSLFVRALAQFKNLNPIDEAKGMLSYFQIAGIHGEPSQTWDSAPPPVFDPKIQQGGYCAHNVTTFPTWHRPYMLLFEQRLWEIMQALIAGFVVSESERTLSYEASNTFRLPYWDWGTEQPYLGQYGVPNLLTQQTVMIVIPGTDFKLKEPYENPLNQFKNPLGVAMGDKSMGQFAIPDDDTDPDVHLLWASCIGTSRYGIFNSNPVSTWADGVVVNDKVNLALQTYQWYAPKDVSTGPPDEPIKEVVHRLFSNQFTSWKHFATTEYEAIDLPPGEDFVSLEYIHNNIHNWSGGGDPSGSPNDPISMLKGAGHMGDISVAAFDPIFWLHHCNIDRLLAVWQILNPGKWFDPQDALNGESPLQPFHTDTSGDSWTSDLCKEISNLNYTYDSLGMPPQLSDDPLVAQASLLELRKQINSKYGETRKALLHDGPSVSGSENDYLINVVYDRYAIHGAPYTILFFLGNPEARDDRNVAYLGSVYNFSSVKRAQEGTCANCQQQQNHGVLSKASLPITVPLLKQAQSNSVAGFESLVGNDVEDHLQQRLTWRVVRRAGPLPANQEIPGLKVFVMKGTAEHSPDPATLSSFHSYKRLKSATDGKTNGLGADEPDLALE